MTPILEVSDLTVKYKTVQGDSTAVDHVDLTVDRGEDPGDCRGVGLRQDDPGV